MDGLALVRVQTISGIDAVVENFEALGIVEFCDGINVTAIEGNNNDAVRRRTMRVGASYITGYGFPAYNAEPSPEPEPIPEHIIPDPIEGAEHVYRLYNPTTGEHFYTASVD